MPAFSVLHVTSIPGGGVDRHLRDIARASAHAHLVWHASDGGDLLEIPAEHRALPLDRAAIARDPASLVALLRQYRVGLVHAHAVTEAPRARAQWACDALAVP